MIVRGTTYLPLEPSEVARLPLGAGRNQNPESSGTPKWYPAPANRLPLATSDDMIRLLESQMLNNKGMEEAGML
jgi:hypothetical protein